MSRPKLDRRANGVKLSWELEKIQIALNNLDTHHGKNVSAFLVATYTDDKGAIGHLLQAEFNLSALRTRQDFSRELAKRYKQFCPQQAETTRWDEIMEQVCVLGQQEAMTGAPAEHVVIESSTIVPAPTYLLEPFIMENQVNCIFGDGGAGKSELACMFYLALSLGWIDNPWGLTVQATPITCLVLDWETDRQDWEFRLNRLSRGASLPPVYLHYSHRFLPLADDIAPIQTQIDEINAGVLIIDSAGVATGAGNMNEPGVANGFFAGLRRFNKTSLILTHNSKGSMAGSDKSPMGSVYYTNVPRNVWHLRKEEEAGKNFITISLSDYKRNNSGKRLPIGFRIEFDDPNARVTADRIKLDGTGLADDLPLKLRIRNLLSSGPRTVKEIADDLGAKVATVAVVVSQLKTVGSIVSLPDNKWGLAALNDRVND